jgi:hypothetical protein
LYSGLGIRGADHLPYRDENIPDEQAEKPLQNRSCTDLVGRVANNGRLPLSTPGNGLASGVGNHVRNPVSVLLVVPLLGLLGLGIGDDLGLVDEPVLRHGSGFVDDRSRSSFVPVVRLGDVCTNSVSVG